MSDSTALLALSARTFGSFILVDLSSPSLLIRTSLKRRINASLEAERNPITKQAAYLLGINHFRLETCLLSHVNSHNERVKRINFCCLHAVILLGNSISRQRRQSKTRGWNQAEMISTKTNVTSSFSTMALTWEEIARNAELRKQERKKNTLNGYGDEKISYLNNWETLSD